MDLMSMIDGNMVDVIRKGRYTHILFLFVDDTLDFSPGGPVYDHITCFYYWACLYNDFGTHGPLDGAFAVWTHSSVISMGTMCRAHKQLYRALIISKGNGGLTPNLDYFSYSSFIYWLIALYEVWSFKQLGWNLSSWHSIQYIVCRVPKSLLKVLGSWVCF